MYISGCSLNTAFFTKILKYIPDSGLSRFTLGVNVRKKNDRSNTSSTCSRTGRVQKNHNIYRKNTIFNEHPVYNASRACGVSGWTERWDCEDVTDGGSEGKERAPLHMKKIVIKNTKKEYFLELMPLHFYTTML